MIRTLAAATALALATLASAAAASAQTYGQPAYLNAYGRPVGGTPLSEVETWSYVATGYRADGFSDRLHVHVPAPEFRRGYGYGHARGHRSSGHGYSRYVAPSQAGYRDEWGYSDDRPPSPRRWSDDRGSRRYERDCGCSDVYLYDR